MRLPVYYPSTSVPLLPRERVELVLSDVEDEIDAIKLTGKLVAAIMHPTYSFERDFPVIARVHGTDGIKIDIECLQRIDILSYTKHNEVLAKLIHEDDVDSIGFCMASCMELTRGERLAVLACRDGHKRMSWLKRKIV